MEEWKGDVTNPAGFPVGRGWGDREGRWRTVIESKTQAQAQSHISSWLKT